MARQALKLTACVLAAFCVAVHWRGHAHTVVADRPASCTPARLEAADPCLAQWQARYRPPGPPPFPDDDPFSPAKAELGRLLFFEPLLSSTGSTSCATCHNPGLSWGDGLPRAVGDNALPLALRSPTVIDLAWLSVFGWDGKFPTLESVTFAAITGKGNMGLDEQAAKQRLSALPAYDAAFRRAFGDPNVTRERIESAIATYERTLVSAPTPFDHWIGGDPVAISDAAKRGFTVFNGPGNCAACHSGWSFTDGSFHDIGSANGDDTGRGRSFPTSVKLRYAFKVPTLRDVARRAPYMHDGSIASLPEVIDLYDRGGTDRPSRSPEIRPLHLSAEQKSDLVAFLDTLTSPPDPVPLPILPR